MSYPYVGEIIPVAFEFAPSGWAHCDGQLLEIAQNEVLFQLIGTTYGGDGQETFALPDLRGRAPVHQGQAPGGSSYQIGDMAGAEAVTLSSDQMPSHTHTIAASSSFTSTDPSAGVPAPGSAYGDTDGTSMHPAMLSAAGGGQPHENMSPYVAVNWVISLFGIFPSPN
jgi:microcystin-dependent protein